MLLGLFALLFVISLSAYHWSGKKTKPAVQENQYTWHKYNEAGDQELVPAVTFFGTAEEAEEEFDCLEGSLVICARAYNGVTPLNIYVLKSTP